jgi:ketosteroid isomerase-like protein
MSNLEAVNALLSAINLDRFAEIESLHNPGVTFWSFRGPNLHDSVAVADWHREFLRDYQDCNYADVEYIEDGDLVAARATIQAKGYDWRPFEQRVVEVFRLRDGGVEERRLYAMLPNLELDKAATAATANATGFKGGSIEETRAAVAGFYDCLLLGGGNATDYLDPKAALIDSVYGVTSGAANILDLLASRPRPAFGVLAPTRAAIGQKDAAVELSYDPHRPRLAEWVRVVEGKIAVIESYWMLREIGVSVENRKRHARQVIMPI